MMFKTKSEFVAERNRLLANSDFVLLPDSKATDAMLTSAISYRQSLRDCTGHVTDENVGDAVLPLPGNPALAKYLGVEIPAGQEITQEETPA